MDSSPAVPNRPLGMPSKKWIVIIFLIVVVLLFAAVAVTNSNKWPPTSEHAELRNFNWYVDSSGYVWVEGDLVSKADDHWVYASLMLEVHDLTPISQASDKWDNDVSRLIWVSENNIKPGEVRHFKERSSGTIWDAENLKLYCTSFHSR